MKKQFPPTRLARYCCEKLKEANGEVRIVVTGVKWAESLRRKSNQGLVTIFNGKAAKVADAQGARYTDNRARGIIMNYEYVGDRTVSFFGEALDFQMHLYKTEDADAGEFTYFAFADDTPGETQHIEYRYGADEENLANYSEGEYAYWLASGILDGYKESMIQDCIKLFVDENVGGQGD